MNVSYYDYGYDYGYSSTVELDQGAVLAIVLGYLIFGILAYVFFAIFMSKIFKKLGVEPAWSAWVPFYGQWKFLEAGGQQGWWMFVPFANVVFSIIAVYNIGLKFGKGGGWVALYLFLAPVWLILLAMKSAQPVANPHQMNTFNVAPQDGQGPTQTPPQAPPQM